MHKCYSIWCDLEPLPVTTSTPRPSLTPLKSPTKLPALPSSAMKMPPLSASASSKVPPKPTHLRMCDVSIVRSTRSTTPRPATLEQDLPSITVLAQSPIKRKAEDPPVGPVSFSASLISLFLTFLFLSQSPRRLMQLRRLKRKSLPISMLHLPKPKLSLEKGRKRRENRSRPLSMSMKVCFFILLLFL